MVRAQQRQEDMDAQAACPARYLLVLLLAAPCWALRVGIGETTLTARELLAWAGPLPNGILSLVPETRDDAAPGEGGPLLLPAVSVALAGRGGVVPARLLADSPSGDHTWVPGGQMQSSLVQAPTGASGQVPQPVEAPPPSPMPAAPEPPFTLITWWQLATELQMSGPAVELAPGQDLTLTALSLFLVDLSAPLGYHVTLPTLALASLFAVPASAKLLLQDMVVVLSAVDMQLAMDGICSVYDTDSFPYSPGVVVDGFVVRLIEHTSRAPDENGTAGAGGEVRWINVTLTCPGYEFKYPPCAARPIRGGWELDAAVLRPMLEATVGPVMLSLAPDVALPAGGNWTQVVVPVNQMLVLIGDPSLQLRRGRPTTLDLGGVEGAWAFMRDDRYPWIPPGMAQLRDLQLVNLPYSSMPRESQGLLALSMQSFGLIGQDASGPPSNDDQPPQLRVSRCTLVVSDLELAFLARAAAASISGQGQPNLTALFGDEAGQLRPTAPTSLPSPSPPRSPQPRVGGDPLMDGAKGSLLLEFLQLRSLVAFTDVTLVSASRYSEPHREVPSFATLPGLPPLLPSALVWPPLLMYDRDVALQWGGAGTLVTSAFEEALLAADACGQAPSGRTVIVLSSTDDQSVPPVASGGQLRLLASTRSPLAVAQSCVVAGYPPALSGLRTFVNMQGAISRLQLSSPITLRDLVLYNLAPGGTYPLPGVSEDGSAEVLPPAPQLQGADAPWANSSLPLWYFQCARSVEELQQLVLAAGGEAAAEPGPRLVLSKVTLVVPEAEWRALAAAILLQHAPAAMEAAQQQQRVTLQPLPQPPPRLRRRYSTRTAATGISAAPTAVTAINSVATTCATATALASPSAATFTTAIAAASLAAAIATLLDDHAHRAFGACGLIQESSNPDLFVAACLRAGQGAAGLTGHQHAALHSGAPPHPPPIQVASYSYASGVLLLSEARWYGVYGTDVTVSYTLPNDAPPGAALLSYPPLVLPYQELADLNIDIEVDFSPPLLPPPSTPSQRTPPDLVTTSSPTPAMAQPAPARPLVSDPFNTSIGDSAAGQGSTGVSPTGRSPLLPTNPRPEAPPSANSQLPQQQQPFGRDGLPGEGPPGGGSRGAKPAWLVPVAATVSTVGGVAGLAAAVCIVLAFVKRRQQRGCGATERGPGWIGKHNCAATGQPRSGSSTWGMLLPMTGAQASMVCIRLDSLHEKAPVAATTVACDQTSSSGVGSTDVGAPEHEGSGSHFVVDGGGGGQGSGERGPLGGPATKGSGSHLWLAPVPHQRSLACLIGGSNTAGSVAATSFTLATTTTTAAASSQTSTVRAVAVMAAAVRAASLSAVWRRMVAKARSGDGAPSGGSGPRAPRDPGVAPVGQGTPAGTVEVAAKAGMGDDGAAGVSGSQGSARALRLAPQQRSGATASTAALANQHALQLALLRVAEAEAEAAAAAAVASGASSADEAALWVAQAVAQVQDVQLDRMLPAVAASVLGIPPSAPDAVGGLPLGCGPRPSEQPLEEELQAYFTNLADSVMRGMESRQPALSPVDESPRQSARQQGGKGGARQMTRSIQLLHAQLRDPDLEVHAVLGFGSYGVVYGGVWRGLPVAVKVLVVPAAAAGVEGLPGLAGSRAARTRQRAVLEAAISLSMSHPNVVATFAYELKPLVQQPSPGSTPNWGSEPIAGGGGGGAAPCVEEADGHKLYIVQELCNGGSLAQALAAGMAGSIIAGGLLRRLALRLALDVALGMAHVHGCRIVHGDLKPDNVLLSSGACHSVQCAKQIVEADTGKMPHGPASAGPSLGPGSGPSPGRCVSRGMGSSPGDTLPLTLTAKVADFGLSVPLQEGATHTSNRFQGTPLYCAPEVISAGHLSAKADVWAFGLMLLELFYGCTMASIRSLHDTVQRGLRQGGPLAVGLPQAQSIEVTVLEAMFKSPHLSYARMAAACLKRDPRSRPTFDELASFIQGMLSND
ncbi:Proline-rich receptor-like protein kinase PERK2 [Tetrabaena socialis]|uniref:Proline-rich receptor-like protein kinase PERK2 n=1 Tax=Tetrabaena socialis TaxID=47790 RepID=A0A2J8A4S2_9CHLO|nr:Proline-rich receptor-like protein kinase PERK2 [Tetrabaena socialis]|eukprot:PNH07503.1 Proline-rich receptor-like protein kinase PERK2 [Tetrabaena socialis]